MGRNAYFSSNGMYDLRRGFRKPARPVLDPNGPINRGTLGRWLLGDRASGLTPDIGPNALNGTIVGTSGLASSHHGGLAQTFDGSTTYIKLAGAALLSTAAPVKISAWLYVTSFPGAGSFQTVFDTGFNDITTVDGLYFRLHGSAFECGRYNGTVTQASWTYSGWPVNTWHYLEGGWDGTQWFITFDGATVATTVSANGPIADSGAVPAIGAQRLHTSGDGSVFWNGRIEGLRIAKYGPTSRLYTEPYAGIYEPAPRWRVGSAAAAARRASTLATMGCG